MLKWFRDCKNTKDCKSKYHALCRQYHPDMSGKDTTAEMQEINNEFKEAFEYFKAHEVHGSPEQAKQTNRKTAETPEHFMKIIEKLIHCDGLTIEITVDIILSRLSH